MARITNDRIALETADDGSGVAAYHDGRFVGFFTTAEIKAVLPAETPADATTTSAPAGNGGAA